MATRLCILLLLSLFGFTLSANYVSFVGTQGTCNGNPSTTASSCPGLQLVNVTADATIFNTADKTKNTVTFVSGVGTAPVCVPNCTSCSVDSAGKWFTCALLVYRDSDGSTWTSSVAVGGVSLTNTVNVKVVAASAPIVRTLSASSCAWPFDLYTATNAVDCHNGKTITIWGSNFDTLVNTDNVVSFSPTSNSGPEPYCYSPGSLVKSDGQYITCNFTVPPGARGPWRVQVTTTGQLSSYPSGTGDVTIDSNITKTLTPSRTPTVTCTSTPTPTPTTTHTPTSTSTPTPTSTSTSTPTPTPTSTPTATPSPTPTATSTPTPTPTSTATPTPTPTSTATPTP
eukprot:RCo033850